MRDRRVLIFVDESNVVSNVLFGSAQELAAGAGIGFAGIAIPNPGREKLQ
jgi:hypothetical protein